MKKIFSFGEEVKDLPYKVLNENAISIGAKIMFFLGLIALVNVLFLGNYIVLPYIAGLLFLNFFIAIVVNPKFAPINIIASFLVINKKKKYIGAIQKRFAWLLGFLLTGTVFILSFYLLNDISYFPIVCFLCLSCIILMGMEGFFGICVGCDIYKFLLEKKILKEPKVKPNCSGDRCDTKIKK